MGTFGLHFGLTGPDAFGAIPSMEGAFTGGGGGTFPGGGGGGGTFPGGGGGTLTDGY